MNTFYAAPSGAEAHTPTPLVAVRWGIFSAENARHHWAGRDCLADG